MKLYMVTLGYFNGAKPTLRSEIVRAEFQDRAADEALARYKASGLTWEVLAVHEALPAASNAEVGSC